MDKEQIRQKAAERVNAIYGLKDPSPEDVKKMIDTHFGPSPVVMFPGMPQQHLLFGCHQGHGNLNAHFNSFYETIEYMITTEVPQGLEGSIYIEEDEGRLRLLSSRDSGFVRVYDVPPNCLVDDVESETQFGVTTEVGLKIPWEDYLGGRIAIGYTHLFESGILVKQDIIFVSAGFSVSWWR